MKESPTQGSLFEGGFPENARDREAARQALDELFALTHLYRQSDAYIRLLQFIARFRFYSPFNATLVHIQMPGARYVATARQWLSKYRRRIAVGAQPLVMLQPMGPVMFVFDVAQTEAEDGAPPLPHQVVHPFEVRHGSVGSELAMTIQNAARDGIQVVERSAGSQRGGEIRPAKLGRHVQFPVGTKRSASSVRVPLRYELLLNDSYSREAKYATLVHELGHLYCGHLGSLNKEWWPDRRGVRRDVGEFEAESVCYLVCARLDIDNPSEEYLAQYVRGNAGTPDISLDLVLGAARLIEDMGRKRLSPRPRAKRSISSL